MALPFGALRFLYIGTKDTGADLDYFVKVLGGKKVWRFKEFGADVAAVQVGEGPLLLLADHREAPSIMPIFEVDDIGKTVKDLKSRGWKPKGARFEIPNGPCFVFVDPSGNEYAIFEDVRPGVFGPE